LTCLCDVLGMKMMLGDLGRHKNLPAAGYAKSLPDDLFRVAVSVVLGRVNQVDS